MYMCCSSSKYIRKILIHLCNRAGCVRKKAIIEKRNQRVFVSAIQAHIAHTNKMYFCHNMPRVVVRVLSRADVGFYVYMPNDKRRLLNCVVANFSEW